MLKEKNFWKKSAALLTAGAALLGFTAFSAAPATEAAEMSSAATELSLPTVGNIHKLQDLLKDCMPEYVYSPYMLNTLDGAGSVAPTTMMAKTEAAEEPAEVMESGSDSATAETAASEDYSSTNVQTEGVDEADFVKTDGSFLYKVSNDGVDIVQALPADAMVKMSSIKFDSESNFTPDDLYISPSRLVVMGTYWQNDEDSDVSTYYNLANTYYCDSEYGEAILVYDVTDKTKPRLMRQENLPGQLISSRKVGNMLYFAVNQSIDTYFLKEAEDSNRGLRTADFAPRYTEKTFDFLGNKIAKRTMDLAKVHYFPDCIQPDYLLVGALDLSDLSIDANVKAWLADGNNLYASTENLYVALAEWHYNTEDTDSNTTTDVYRFHLDGKNITCTGKGQVPGDIIGQFAMDERDGYFRIATTTETYTTQYETSNNLYVLDENLQKVGEITKIAPGEQIYSVRFAGDRAYVVTFKTVDPFFVMDLSDPTKPTVLGALKIPGYSDYLHPYDENHIIGFGKETMELNGTAYYLGMKVSLFDVTDVANPVEISKVTIGDRGTDSELLYDHKALLLNTAKNLLAFPVEVCSLGDEPVVNNEYGYGYPNYGTFSYQGAYIYDITPEGFNFKGRITHISDEEYKKSGNYWGNSDENIRRILYIGNTLYTVSNDKIKANDLTTLEEIGSLDLTE